jgi:MFS family permease
LRISELKYCNSTRTVTSIAAGRVGDLIGRRGTLFVGAVVFTLGGAVQTFTVGFWSMVTGRIISGFGVGLLSSVFCFDDLFASRNALFSQNDRPYLPERNLPTKSCASFAVFK